MGKLEEKVITKQRQTLQHGLTAKGRHRRKQRSYYAAKKAVVSAGNLATASCRIKRDSD